MKRFWIALSVVCSCFWPVTLVANTDDVLLTIRNGETVQRYSLRDLQDMPQRTIETSTIWTDGTQVFVGVSLHHLLAVSGVTEGTLEAAAINDYAIDIPLSDAAEDGPIVAFLRNGSLMSLREKGPLWIVYPFDTHTEYQNESTYSRSIWQLDRITVK